MKYLIYRDNGEKRWKERVEDLIGVEVGEGIDEVWGGIERTILEDADGMPEYRGLKKSIPFDTAALGPGAKKILCVIYLPRGSGENALVTYRLVTKG